MDPVGIPLMLTACALGLFLWICFGPGDPPDGDGGVLA